MAGYDTNLTVYDSPGCPAASDGILACADDEAQPVAPAFEIAVEPVELHAGLAGFDAIARNMVKLVTGKSKL